MSRVQPRSDLLGRQFGRLTVMAFSHRERVNPNTTRLWWRCRCDCGAEKIVLSGQLRQGLRKSCGGCPKPGGNRLEWPGCSSWKGMLARCVNATCKHYDQYGGRGITVCDRWRFGEDGKTGFECFFEDVGPRPEGLTLDRIDPDGNYEPGNCRWATRRRQQQNQRRSIFANIGGVKVPLSNYVERLGLCYESVRFRVRKHNETVCEAARGLLSRRAA
jgi:hypothetical protein